MALYCPNTTSLTPGLCVTGVRPHMPVVSARMPGPRRGTLRADPVPAPPEAPAAHTPLVGSVARPWAGPRDRPVTVTRPRTCKHSSLQSYTYSTGTALMVSLIVGYTGKVCKLIAGISLSPAQEGLMQPPQVVRKYRRNA